MNEAAPLETVLEIEEKSINIFCSNYDFITTLFRLEKYIPTDTKFLFYYDIIIMIYDTNCWCREFMTPKTRNIIAPILQGVVFSHHQRQNS